MAINTKQAVKQLLPFLGEHRIAISVVVALLLINSAIIIAVGFGASYIVDNLPTSPSEAKQFIDRVMQWTLFAIILGTLVRFFHNYLLARISTLIIEDIRRRVFDNITAQNIAFFDNHQSGDMQTRIIADINVVGQFVSTQIPVNLASLVRLIGGIAGASVISLPLTIAVMIGLPLLFSPFFFVARYIRRFSSQVQGSTSELGRFTGESFRNAKIVHAYGRQAQQMKTFSSLARSVVSFSLKRAALEQSTSAIINGFAMTGAALLLWYCATNIYSGAMTVGMLVSFSYFVYMVAMAASKLVSSVSALNSALGAADKIVGYLELEPHRWPSRVGLESSACAIEFVDVSFRYPNRPDVKVLDHFTTSFKLGSHVAIVGSSGAGKSTVFELILRFYQPQVGAIFFGKQNINDLSMNDYRSFFGYVPQKESLVSGTVLENICFGNSKLTLKDAREAVKIVGLDEFILQLPTGYDTDLGEVAGRLSGGQKQRLAIARALVYEPKVLLLDEANSALDAQSDRRIAHALKLWVNEQKATLLTIAHRLETAQLADSIVVMDSGKVVGEGSHHALKQSCEIYRRLLQETEQQRSQELEAVI